MRIYRKINFYILLFLIVFTSMVFIIPQRAYAIENIQRLEGKDRYDTAIAISQKGWTTSINVVLATGKNYPDALCAAPLARKLNAPILLTEGDAMEDTVFSRIGELKASNVFIIGGSGVISDKIMQRLTDAGLNVKRLAGNDRYDTALEVAKYISYNFGLNGEIAVATGDNYPDALSIAPAAAASGMPIILTEKDKLPYGAADFIKEKSITKTYIAGGRGVIASSVEQAVPGAVRLWGNDRYETNASVLGKFKNILNYGTTYIATGENYPDALAGSGLAPVTSSPIILTEDTPEQSTIDIMGLNYPDIKNIYVLGGSGAVSEDAGKALSLSDINLNGNSLSNINNFGIASMQAGWIYYSNFSDNQRLYKMKADGSQNQLLLNDVSISHINVAGDYIYYSGEDGKVYKVRTDGSGKSLVIDGEVYFLYVSNKHIYYYSDGSLNNMDMGTGYTKKLITADDRWHYYITGSNIYFTDGGRLYRTDINGMNKTLLINDSVVEFGVAGNNIFYFTPAQTLYRTDLEGNGGTVVTSDRVVNIDISGSYIYYLNASDNNTLYRIAFDGSSREKLADYSVSGSINVSGNIVFCADMDVKTSLYSMDPGGVNRSKLMDAAASYLISSGDYIYYVDMLDGDRIYSMKSDGTMKRDLGVSSIGPIELYGGTIYYSSDDNTLHSIRTDGSGDTRLNGISSADFKINDGFIYFNNLADDNKLYKTKLDGTGSVMIGSGSARNIILNGGRIYYINDGDGIDGAGIYSVNSDGTDSRLIESTNADKMTMAAGYIIYHSISNDSDQIVRERTDGSDKLILANNKVDYASDGIYIYTIDGTNNIITRYNPVDGTSSVYNIDGDIFSIIDGSGRIYYQINDSSLKLYQTPLW